MTDLRTTILPKSDQINADNLIGGPITIKVTKVSLCPEAEQPIAINFEGDNGKPFKPGKSMRRVLVNVWGPDGNAYTGRSMTLYRDDKVQFGGLAVGGIRISHMSNIKAPVTMALTATRANRKPFTVKPLIEDGAAELIANAESAAGQGVIAYQAFWTALTKAQREGLLPRHDALKASAKAADDAHAMQDEETEAESIDEIEENA
jgi:hypothetical protein